MRVLVTGATGFTGSYTVPLLLKRGIDVKCLVRKTSDLRFLPQGKIKLSTGDIHDFESVQKACRHVDALIHILSMGAPQATASIVAAAEKRGIRRAVFVSTTAIFTQLNVASKQLRIASEKIIKMSSLNYTIIRPTMIYGNGRDRNICRLIRYLKKWPVIPIFGSGRYLQQPVYVNDVAGALCQALLEDRTIKREYNIAGKAPLSFINMIDTVCEALDRRVLKFFLPAGPVIKGLSVLDNAGIKCPIKGEQVKRLNENKDFDYSSASLDFGFQPCTFKEGLRYELQALN